MHFWLRLINYQTYHICVFYKMDPVFFMKSTKIGVFYQYGYIDITKNRASLPPHTNKTLYGGGDGVHLFLRFIFLTVDSLILLILLCHWSLLGPCAKIKEFAHQRLLRPDSSHVDGIKPFPTIIVHIFFNFPT